MKKEAGFTPYASLLISLIFFYLYVSSLLEDIREIKEMYREEPRPVAIPPKSRKVYKNIKINVLYANNDKNAIFLVNRFIMENSIFKKIGMIGFYMNDEDIFSTWSIKYSNRVDLQVFINTLETHPNISLILFDD